jgi:hypothetical protein
MRSFGTPADERAHGRARRTAGRVFIVTGLDDVVNKKFPKNFFGNLLTTSPVVDTINP